MNIFILNCILNSYDIPLSAQNRRTNTDMQFGVFQLWSIRVFGWAVWAVKFIYNADKPSNCARMNANTLIETVSGQNDEEKKKTTEFPIGETREGERVRNTCAVRTSSDLILNTEVFPLSARRFCVSDRSNYAICTISKCIFSFECCTAKNPFSFLSKKNRKKKHIWKKSDENV